MTVFAQCENSDDVVCLCWPLTGECSNKECPFLHIDPESKIKDCPWYDRGFCKHGRLCSVVGNMNTNTSHTPSVCYGSLFILLSQVLTADTDTQDEWSVWTTWWASVQKENPVNLCSMCSFSFDSCLTATVSVDDPLVSPSLGSIMSSSETFFSLRVDATLMWV